MIVVPFALAVILSFTDARLVSRHSNEFVGWTNYVALFTDGEFLHAVINNFWFAVIVVPAQTMLAVWLAMIVNRPYPGRNLFRTLYFLPVVAVPVVAATIWRLIFADFGLLNQLINQVAGDGVAPHWLQDSTWALPAIMLTFLWRNVGFQMVIVLAGLQAIPRELNEAAAVDGSSRWQLFRYVTLPQLRNTIVFVVTITIIFAFRLYDEVSVMTGGGPRDSTNTMMLQLVQVGFREQKIGRASAIAVFFFLLVLGVTLLQRLLVKEEEAA
jgi:multiple sugar transport system permease protein